MTALAFSNNKLQKKQIRKKRKNSLYRHGQRVLIQGITDLRKGQKLELNREAPEEKGHKVVMTQFHPGISHWREESQQACNPLQENAGGLFDQTKISPLDLQTSDALHTVAKASAEGLVRQTRNGS